MSASLHFIGMMSFVGLLFSCQLKEAERAITQTITTRQSDACDNPDADIHCCFANMPNLLTSVMNIPNSDAGAEKLIISGTIYKKDGKTPIPGVILYAYHTNTKGEYSKKGTEKGVQKWHGSHHGWCKTDANGKYRIETIRPASYPGNTTPAHIHAAVKLPDNPNPFYITDFMFKDDPLLPKAEQNRFSYQGGSGIVAVQKVNNVWIGKRDLVLN
ncbi:dioxygenase family protein [Flavobacterium suncheonense]|uniref:dioxygenase family protein n=1 Tax=Flavobacterium suncheonense TaxID=350894 RepID=UPI000400E728|nr:hypothetical protein [Flavobacterium suncheonense]